MHSLRRRGLVTVGQRVYDFEDGGHGALPPKSWGVLAADVDFKGLITIGQ